MTVNEFLKNLSVGEAYTANGAISNATSGSFFADQFAKCGSSVGRPLMEVFKDQSSLWAENPLDSIRFAFYLRMITRKVRINSTQETNTVQKGQGNFDEALKRMLWIALYHPESFYKNLWIIPLVGSWKDMWILMSMSDKLDREKFFETMAKGLKEKSQIDLVLKYMPRIRSNSKCKTDWAYKSNALAKEFCSYLGLNEKEYRLLKSTGKAHEFQRKICGRLFDEIDFNLIPGKALFNLTKNDAFLKEHGIYDKYINWLKKQPIAKFTGFVYELAMAFRDNQYNISLAKKMTIDKQFDGLIELAKKDRGGLKGNVWCCLDTSGSMNASVKGTNARCCDIANSLAIYFSELNEGEFHNCVMSFDDTSKLCKLSGTFTEKMMHLPYVSCGGTNFQGVIDEIIRVRKSNPRIPLDDYPKTILVVSDMQFNPSGGYLYRNNRHSQGREATNYEEMKNKLYAHFPKKFVDEMKFIWWHVTSAYKDFPVTIDDPGTYMFSGFDGAIITLLLGSEDSVDENGNTIRPTMEELIKKAITQEILLQLKL